MTLTRLHLRRFTLFAVLIAFLPSAGYAGTWVAFQNSYTRGTGLPLAVTDTFTALNPTTQYTLKVFNGGLQDDTTELVSSCVVLVNGAQVVGPGNFNKNVSELNVPVTLLASNAISVQVKGKPGGVLTIQIIGVDNDPPTITASLSPAPNAAGWNNSSVTVTFSCSDKTSGVASCPSPVTVSTEGANQPVSGTATDLAGNTASTSVTVNLDRTPPTITGTINPPPDAGGYNSGPVTVTFTCADALSGVASCLPSSASVTTEGTTPVVGTAVDVAGNTATTTVTVNISFNYFKIRSWQTNPSGDPSQTGKCLDYSATVFLNDCSAAHPIRVVELAPNCNSPRIGSHGTPLCYEVMLFAGNSVIGVHNPGNPIIGTAPPPPPIELQLQLQAPYNSQAGTGIFTATQQVFRLDGDSIILEGSHLELRTNTVLPTFVEVPGPCINTATSTTVCPPPLPQLVIQVQNARGANGSPLVAAVRNLSDNEFWDFVPSPGSRPYPTTGFISMVAPPGAPPSSATPITTNWQLWNAICTTQVIASPGPPLRLDNGLPLTPDVACSPAPAWGSVVLIAGSDPSECTGSSVPAGVGACIDLSNYPPITFAAGATLRGNRRGTLFGPQLYLAATDSSNQTMLKVQGDYVRVAGLRLRGQSRATDKTEPGTEAIHIYSLQSAGSLTELIATIDHNDMSDWGGQAVGVDDAYSGPSQSCTGVANDPATLANATVARNFLHHNERDSDGYGVLAGRAFIEGNTFLMNRHDIAGGSEAHTEYRAWYNLKLSTVPQYSLFAPFNQDFDMHGSGSGAYGGIGGYGVDIAANTFLGDNNGTFAGSNYNFELRGYPCYADYFRDNVTERQQDSNGGGVINFHNVTSGTTTFTLGPDGPSSPVDVAPSPAALLGNPTTLPPGPVFDYSNQFGNSSPPYINPTMRFGVGDFEGDGDDDLFLATGVAWYYSPAGAREWRFLSAKVDRTDTLLLGDFDGDGRTDVVGMNPSGQFDVSWGGVSDWEVINATPCTNGVPNPCPTSVQNMVVGDFDGDGKPDILYTDKIHWYISYGGTMPFAQVNDSSFLVQDLRFGHFAVCGSGAETDVFSVQNTGWFVSCGATTPWQPLGVALTKTIDGLVVADFDGDGIADVATNDHNDWMISFGSVGGWTHYNVPDTDRCGSPEPTLPLMPGIGYFARNRGVDVLLWDGGNEFCIAAGGNAAGQVGWTTGLQAYSTQDMR